ncbi:MAG: LysM peptidoglycan-binding domain-containing protein [Treponema sp.]|jgi:nucleoid-associated protein YgaU|nr:LysM peptidoglycan-binding domain-containing protein [Treponema sp.]
MATIGIKIANGDFYPLLDENDPQKKKFALIPARKGQKQAQIDFYKSEMGVMEDVRRIGRLSFGNEKREMDEDTIDLTLEASGQGKISVSAKNLKTGEDRQLVIWPKTIDQDDGRNGRRLYADEKIEKPEIAEIIEDNSGLLLVDSLYEQRFAKKSPLIPICIAALSLAAVCGLLWFFLFRGKTSASEATAETPEPAPPAPAYAEKPPEQEPATGQAGAIYYVEIAKPVQSEQKPQRPSAPVRSYKAPKPIPQNGATYKVRWGDTLWDIADVFYNNPWLYTRLARYNKLRPSAILLPGVVLRIPPKL